MSTEGFVERDSTEDLDYHFKIQSPHGRIEDSRRFGLKVDNFLDDIFAAGTEPDLGPPLKFADRKLTSDGSQAVLVKFQLSDSATIRGVTFDDAVKDLCERMFQPSSHSYISSLTPRLLVGISAVNREVANHWNQAFFAQNFQGGPDFLQQIRDSLQDDCIPNWVLALSFATVAGVNVLGYKSKAWSESKAVKIFGPAGIAVATSILERLSEEKKKSGSQELSQADRQRNYEEALRSFNTSMKHVLEAVNFVAYPTRNPCREQEETYGNLMYACYEATLAAGRALITNRDILHAYVKMRNDAAKEMVKNAATAAICLTNIGSAFALSTSYSVLPLAEWTLGNAASYMFLGEVPCVATTVLMVNPLLAGTVLLGTAIAGVCAYRSRQEKQKFEKKVKYHKDLVPLVSRAWGLAEETRTLLQWIYCTDACDATGAIFVDAAAERRWASFIQVVKAKLGQPVTAADLDAKHIIEYLRVQKEDFEKWRKRMDVHEVLGENLQG